MLEAPKVLPKLTLMRYVIRFIDASMTYNFMKTVLLLHYRTFLKYDGPIQKANY